MISVKNLQWLNELLLQEEMLQAIAMLYFDLNADKELKTMFTNITNTSKKNHEELLSYVKSHC